MLEEHGAVDAPGAVIAEPAPRASLRRPSVAVGVVIGLLMGSLLTALITAGDNGGPASSEVASVGGALDAPAPLPTGGTTATTSGAPTPTVGGLAAPTPTAPPSSSGAASSGGASSGGASSGGAVPATTAPSTQASSTCAGSPATGVRGVTDTVIKIGVGLPDIRAFEPILGQQAHMGNQQAHFEAHLAAMRKKGLLPICGRDIQAVYRSYNILDPSQSRAVCQAFINDEKVFAVLTQFAFGDPNCVTQENKTFLLDHGGSLTDANYQAGGGRLYGLHPSSEVQMRIWATWGSKTYAAGKKVGVYYNNSDSGADATVKANILDVMRRYGIEPVVATSNTPSQVGAQADPNDAVAVQKFRVAGVQVAYLVTTASITGGFMKEAQRQGFRPLYLRYGAGVKDASSGSVDPAYFDGSKGIHWDQSNDYNRGVPPSAQAESCMKEAEAAGIPRPHPEWAEWDGTMLSCDLLAVFTAGLKAAGRTVTTDRVALGVQTIRNLATSLVAPVSYASNKPWGISKNREAQYYKDCKCWKNIGPWLPLYL